MNAVLNPHYIWLDFTRQLRMPVNLFFTIILPTVLFVVFGVAQSYASLPAGHGTVSAMIMAGMAVYGAVTATTSLAGTAALEQQYGWRRQLALTPYTHGAFIRGKVAMALMVAALPVTLVLVVGLITNAELDAAWRWFAIWGLCMLGAALFSLYGLAIATWFRSEEAVGLASGLLVVLFFLGNGFMPLSGVMLDIGRFTPAYGLIGLARYPVTDGVVDQGGTDPLGLLIGNMVLWTLIFAAMTALGARRGTARQ